MPFSKKANLLFLALAGLTLSACSIVPGNDDFSCPGGANVIRCKSARDIYDMTTGRDELSPADFQEKKDDEKKEEDAGPIVSTPRPIEPTPVTAEYGRVPIRTPSKVQKIWVAPFEDEDGDLVVGGLLYVEIERKRWQIGQPVSETGAQNMAPLTDQFNAKPAAGIMSAPKQTGANKAPVASQNPVPVASMGNKIPATPVSSQ